MIVYNKIKVGPQAKPETQALANAANTVTRPGPLTSEWWSVLLATGASSVLAAVGLPGPTAAQVAAIIAPIVLALVYALVRAQTKGALADALKAVFPQATTNPPGQNANAANGAAAGSPPAPVSATAAAAPGYQLPAIVPGPASGDQHN